MFTPGVYFKTLTLNNGREKKGNELRRQNRGDIEDKNKNKNCTRN